MRPIRETCPFRKSYPDVASTVSSAVSFVACVRSRRQAQRIQLGWNFRKGQPAETTVDKYADCDPRGHPEAMPAEAMPVERSVLSFMSRCVSL
jgi:hypothetical protein